MSRYRNNKPVAELGDKIKLAGYGERMFTVYHVSLMFELDTLDFYEEISYDVAYTHKDGLGGERTEHLVAFQEDIRHVHRPHKFDQAELENYLAQRDADIAETMASLGLDGYELVTPDGMTDQTNDLTENTADKKGVNDRKIEEEIDELLTQLSDYYTLVGLVGDDYEDGDGYYRRKIYAIKHELRKLTQ